MRWVPPALISMSVNFGCALVSKGEGRGGFVGAMDANCGPGLTTQSGSPRRGSNTWVFEKALPERLGVNLEKEVLVSS